MALLTVDNITVNTLKIPGIEVIKCDTAYFRGKSKILAPHPILQHETFSVFEGPHAQVQDLYKKIRMAWFINTPLYIPDPLPLTEEERLEAYSEVYQNNDQLIYDGLNWLLWQTHKDILVGTKIVIHGSSDPEARKPEKRVYTFEETDESFADLSTELLKIINEPETVDRIINRLKKVTVTTVH